jgi:hypothetical protein
MSRAAYERPWPHYKTNGEPGVSVGLAGPLLGGKPFLLQRGWEGMCIATDHRSEERQTYGSL